MTSRNVRTLVDIEGSSKTARQRCNESIVDERKIDQVISELDRYQVSVAALKETKWFGSKIYSIGSSVVSTAGRDVPEVGRVRQRSEGVAIVLSGKVVNAWKAGGSQWKAWSSRLITATLEVGSGRMHTLSCYAPTFAATREKDQFFDNLQAALSSILSDECYVMMGDFNARVGSRGANDDDWWYERGPHGYGELNEAGRELLSMNEAMLCNIWFKKKDIHKQTWQHPKSLKWHCIDYVIMRMAHRRKCLDVSVMRGADCNTDHRLSRAKVVIGRKKLFRRRDATGTAVRRWNVMKLKGKCVDEKGRETSFVRAVEQKLQTWWDETNDVREKWDTLKTALCDGANWV